MFTHEWQEWVFGLLCAGFLISIALNCASGINEFRRQNRQKKQIVLEQSSRSASEPFVTILKMDRAGNFIITDALLAELMAKEKDLWKALGILSEVMRKNCSTSVPKNNFPLVV